MPAGIAQRVERRLAVELGARRAKPGADALVVAAEHVAHDADDHRERLESRLEELRRRRLLAARPPGSSRQLGQLIEPHAERRGDALGSILPERPRRSLMSGASARSANSRASADSPARGSALRPTMPRSGFLPGWRPASSPLSESLCITPRHARSRVHRRTPQARYPRKKRASRGCGGDAGMRRCGNRNGLGRHWPFLGRVVPHPRIPQSRIPTAASG